MTRQRDEADRDWMNEGACVGMDQDLFFTGSSAEWRAAHGLVGRTQEWEEAKEVCRGCTVRLECLAYAKRYHEDKGVWGGQDEKERRRKPSKMTHEQRADREQLKARLSVLDGGA